MKPANHEAERTNFALYEAHCPEGKIELVDSRIVVGNTVDGSRLLFDHILRGWSLDAATAFGSIEQWIDALRETYGLIGGVDAVRLPTEWNSPQVRTGGAGPDAGHCRIRQHLSMSFFEAGGELGGEALGGIVMKLADNGFTPDVMFFKNAGLNAIHEYCVDGPAEMVIEVARPAHRDYDVRGKREYYARAGVPEYLIVDAERRSLEFLRLANGAYAVQHPDTAGFYRPTSIPGLAIRVEYLWPKESYTGGLNQNNPFLVEHSRGSGERIKATREGPGSNYLPFEPHVDVQPIPVLFEEYICWAPEAKFEFWDGRIQISGEEGVRKMTGLVLATLGLTEACRFAPAEDWIAALRRRRDAEAREQQTRLEWRRRAVEAAKMLREKYRPKRIAITGSLASPQAFTFWSQLALSVWDVPFEQMQQMYRDLSERGIDVFEADQHWFQQRLNTGEFQVEDI